MTLTANEQGEISGQFIVPENVPTGTKLVQFIGNQGNYGETTYTSRGLITTEDRRRVTTVTDVRRNETTVVIRRFDPLAQTFTLSESRHVGGIELWFGVPGEKRIVAQIRETNVGLPNQTVLAEGDIQPSQINTNGSPTRITWQPVWLEAGREYAIVLMTDDANAAVKIAELGKYDAVHRRWVTSQAYQVGVLLSSSNASTWTPHQEKDLTFRLLAAKFTETNRTIDLGTLAMEDVSDLIALANIERVASDTDAEFSLTDEDGVLYRLADDLPIALRSRLTGNLNCKAHLRGSNNRSPVVYPGVQIICGKIQESADYITRAIPAEANSKVTITYEAFLTGTADVKAYIEMTDNNYQLVELTTGKPVGENWVERTHILENFTGVQTRVKLVLTGNVLYHPRVRNLRVMVT